MDQQAVEVPPFLTNRFLDRFWEGVKRVDGDISNEFRFGSLERCCDPLDTGPYPQKYQALSLVALERPSICVPGTAAPTSGGEVLAGHRC